MLGIFLYDGHQAASGPSPSDVYYGDVMKTTFFSTSPGVDKNFSGVECSTPQRWLDKPLDTSDRLFRRSKQSTFGDKNKSILPTTAVLLTIHGIRSVVQFLQLAKEVTRPFYRYSDRSDFMQRFFWKNKTMYCTIVHAKADDLSASINKSKKKWTQCVRWHHTEIRNNRMNPQSNNLFTRKHRNSKHYVKYTKFVVGTH